MITICDCSPAPATLLRAGLFPCTPQLPSLAVDVELLEFVTVLFLNLPPNNRALCETLEVFLAARRYKLATKVRGIRIIPRCTLITRRILCASGLETRCSGTARSSSPQSFKSTRSFTRPSRKFASAETTGFAGLALYLLPAPSHLLHRYRPPQAPSPSFLPVPQSRAYEPPYHARRSLPEARLHAYAARWHHRPMTSRPMMKSRPGPPILLRTHHLARGPPTIC